MFPGRAAEAGDAPDQIAALLEVDRRRCTRGSIEAMEPVIAVLRRGLGGFHRVGQHVFEDLLENNGVPLRHEYMAQTRATSTTADDTPPAPSNTA